ncbi:RICIN domain-containing protein [Streptomyces sp. NBC_00249]|uniref:RICIN domain-containing protein n=1 Tax=Streptomyces sp. NBC_00249 TaxID=2975690 RepID=UPI00224E9755|nr:RICIN domain-containing protein [Streptomyces sp. NBC_00249]
MRRVVGLLAAAVLVPLFLSASPAAAYGGDLGTWQMLQNYKSGKCLEVADWSTANGAAVRQWDCHAGGNQLWAASFGSAGALVSNRHSGKCLEVADWSTANGAAIRQWDCHGGANQRWDIGVFTNDVGIDVTVLSNRHSGKCLEIADWRTDNGAPARQWDCHYGGNQLF